MGHFKAGTSHRCGLAKGPNVRLLQTLLLNNSVRSSGYERLLTVKGSKPLLVLHAREHAI
jgi:hypothetical protein